MCSFHCQHMFGSVQSSICGEANANRVPTDSLINTCCVTSLCLQSSVQFAAPWGILLTHTWSGRTFSQADSQRVFLMLFRPAILQLRIKYSRASRSLKDGCQMSICHLMWFDCVEEKYYFMHKRALCSIFRATIQFKITLSVNITISILNWYNSLKSFDLCAS